MHRLSRDLDLFCHEAPRVRELVLELPAIAREANVRTAIQRDAGTFVRIELDLGGAAMAADLVHDAVPDIEPPPPPIKSVVVESLADLRASKITCLLSRAAPRDLVDLLFLEKSGFSVQRDLELSSAQRQRHRSGSSRVALARLRCRATSGDVGTTVGR